MSYSTTIILRDLQNNPIPQHYNPITGYYEVTHGQEGSSLQMLCDLNGSPMTLVQLETTLLNMSASIVAKIDELIGVMS